MDRKKIEEFKKVLIEKKKELIKKIDELKEDSLNENLEDPGDPVDRAVTYKEKEFFLSLREKESEILEKIEDALKKIEKGRYGICEICGNEISEKRLEFIPWARYCIECQEKIEKNIIEI